MFLKSMHRVNKLVRNVAFGRAPGNDDQAVGGQ